MAWTDTYDTATPDGSTQKVPVLDDEIRTLKSALQERLNADHVFPLTGTQVSDTDVGKHRKVVFHGVLSAKPTLEDGECALYTKTVSDKSELFFENEDGTEKQLTSEGVLNIALTDIADDLITDDKIQLTVDGWLAGLNTAEDDEINLIKSDGASPILGSGAKTFSSDAPDNNQHVTNKLYVDTQDAAVLAAVTLGAMGTVDSVGYTLVARANAGAHAIYQAPVAGYVTASTSLQNVGWLKGLTGAGVSPSTLSAHTIKETSVSANISACINFWVAAGEYFEVETYDNVSAVALSWRPMGTGAPIKQ